MPPFYIVQQSIIACAMYQQSSCISCHLPIIYRRHTVCDHAIRQYMHAYTACTCKIRQLFQTRTGASHGLYDHASVMYRPFSSSCFINFAASSAVMPASCVRTFWKACSTSCGILLADPHTKTTAPCIPETLVNMSHQKSKYN